MRFSPCFTGLCVATLQLWRRFSAVSGVDRKPPDPVPAGFLTARFHILAKFSKSVAKVAKLFYETRETCLLDSCGPGRKMPDKPIYALVLKQLGILKSLCTKNVAWCFSRFNVHQTIILLVRGAQKLGEIELRGVSHKRWSTKSQDWCSVARTDRPRSHENRDVSTNKSTGWCNEARNRLHISMRPPDVA